MLHAASTWLKQRLLSSVFGTIVLFFVSALFVIIISAALLRLAVVIDGEASSGEEDHAELTYIEHFWAAYTFFIDPGTQTGLEVDTSHPLHQIVAVACSLIGFTWVLVIFGAACEQMGRVLASWRRTHTRIHARQHTVVLGWTDKTLFLLGELAQMLTDGREGGGVLVVLGDEEEIEMKEDLASTYPDWQRRWPRVRLRFWRGKPFEVDDLERVSIGLARHVIVLGGSRDPRIADSKVVAALCALQCLPSLSASGAALEAEVIVEVSKEQNENVCRQLGGATARAITAKGDVDQVTPRWDPTPRVTPR